MAALLLAACATTGPVATPGNNTVTRDVVMAVRAPCPDAKDVPVVPKTVHDEHPTAPTNAVAMPKDQADVAAWIAYLKGEIVAGHARERILADKVLEFENYSETADRIMRRCAQPGQSPAGTAPK
ncbi:MAG TPA: hypothetical protein VFW19_10540 [Allosphingosinicella sp.]|nr:hypothetical protein [Allosphingosinicella sp.]